MNPPEIRALAQPEFPKAAQLLGRGMQDNPIFLKVFQGDPDRRIAALTRMFAVVLDQYRKKGEVWGAFDKDTLVGVCALLEPGRCQATVVEKLAYLPALWSGGLGLLYRVDRWQAGWNRHDPQAAHWHFGPIAVDFHLRGKGIGTALMQAFCARMDAEQSMAYLEADKPVNVKFYQRFGFKVMEEDTTLGVPGWFMQRHARNETGSHP